MEAIISIFSNVSDLYTSNEKYILDTCFTIILILFLGYFIYTLLYSPPTYGKHSSKYKFTIPANLAWFIFTTPCAIISMLFIVNGSRHTSWSSYILLWLYFIHYFNRGVIFSLLIRGGRPVPAVVLPPLIVAIVFNSFAQCLYHTKYSYHHDDWVKSPVYIAGLVMIAVGLAINVHSDHILRNLRAPGESGYKIPRGGFFEYVSGANFFGEFIEWTGYAIASNHFAGFFMPIVTLFNLLPRAIQHHRFYHEKFEDYPKERKIFIPYIF